MYTPSAIVVIILVLTDDFFYFDQKKLPALRFIRIPQSAVISGLAYP
jgi:hypothetical protein